MYDKYCNMSRGKVKRTHNQFKKHRVQMTDKEINYLSRQLCNIKKVRFCQHALCKAMYFDKSEIVHYILTNKDFTADIVEYNATLLKGDKWQKRVLLRLPQEHTVMVNNRAVKKCSLCVVIEYQRGAIVTAYYNNTDDKHTTLDLDRYCASLKII